MSFVIQGVLRCFFFIAAFFLLSVLCPVSVRAESIDAYDISLRLEKTGRVIVNERIDYNFGDLQKHGIFRRIPLGSRDGPRIKISGVSVSDESGTAHQYTTTNVDGYLEYRIGDAQKTTAGKKTYVLRYDVSNVVRGFTDHDELYWNAIGTEWGVPIPAPTVNIEFPPEIPPDSISFYCYVGSANTAESVCRLNEKDGAYTITTTRPLAAREGLTISMSFPHGIVTGLAKKAITENLLSFLQKNWIASLLVWIGILIGYLYLLTLLYKRRARIIIPRELKNISVMAEYSPPDDITPFDASAFSDRRIDVEDIAPVIIDLAIKGYLKINFIDKGSLAGSDYEFVKLRDGADLEHFAYREVFSFLFNVAGTGSVAIRSIKLSDLKKQPRKGAFLIDLLRVKASRYFEGAGYATRDRSHKTDLLHIAVGFVLSGSVWFFTHDFYVPFIAFAVLTSILVLLSQRTGGFILTKQGTAVLYHLLGFKEFLAMTESGRYKLLNAPSLRPEMFERYLPYAMALGVEQKWIDQFSGITTLQPGWVATKDSQFFSPSRFSIAMGSFSTGLKISLTSSVPSGYPFISGWGGFGSSGGGSGGGGGGSW